MKLLPNFHWSRNRTISGILFVLMFKSGFELNSSLRLRITKYSRQIARAVVENFDSSIHRPSRFYGLIPISFRRGNSNLPAAPKMRIELLCLALSFLVEDERLVHWKSDCID
jgi:hypothetical protein